MEKVVKIASLVGMILTLLIMLALSIGVLVGISYHPDSALKNYLLLAVMWLFGLFVMALFMKRWQEDLFSAFDTVFAALLGLLFLGAGSYFAVTNADDALVFPPIALGLCLVLVASEVLMDRGFS